MYPLLDISPPPFLPPKVPEGPAQVRLPPERFPRTPLLRIIINIPLICSPTAFLVLLAQHKMLYVYYVCFFSKLPSS